MGDLLELAVGVVVVLCAIALAAIAGSLAALCVFGAGVYGLVLTLARGIWRRGGAAAERGPDEPAFLVYYRVQMWRDLRCALRAGRRRAEDERAQIMALVPQRSGFLGSLFRIVMRVYGWYAFLLGGLLALLIGGILALVVVVAAGVAWLAGSPLRALEGLRRSRHGAHFDCPVCHERFALPVYVCPECGVRHRHLVPGRYGVLHRRCECGAVLPTLQLTGRQRLPAQCPGQGHSLGRAVGALRTVHVPVAGGVSSGKTTFLAAALYELERRAAVGSLAVAVQESSRAAYESLLSGFRIGALPAKTADTMAPALVAEVRGQSHAALLYAYDVAGEAYARDEELRRDPAYGLADGIVLLVDPFTLDRVRLDRSEEIAAAPELHPSTEAPQRVFERLLGVLQEKGVVLEKLPLAICVTKVDALQIRDAIEGMEAVGEDAKVKAWLLDAGAGNLVRSAEEAFTEVRYFGVSALGRTPGAQAGPFAPLGALEPFLWALDHYGVHEGGTVGAEATTSASLEASGTRSYKPKRPLSTEPIDKLPDRGHLAHFGVGLATFAALTVGFLALGSALQNAQGPGYATAASVSGAPAAAAAGGSSSQPAGGPGGSSSPPGTPNAGASSASSTAARARAAIAREKSPEGVLRRHLEYLAGGSYASAFALFSARYKRENPDWMAQPQAAQPRVTIVSVGPARVYGADAFVHVKFVARDTHPTAASNTKCRRFEGEAHLIREAGRWRYEPGGNRYEVTVLSPSLSICP